MLRTKLLERQADLGLNDGDMAALLDIPRSSYNSIKNGKYRISMVVARRIVTAFPDLAQYTYQDDPSPEPAPAQ